MAKSRKHTGAVAVPKSIETPVPAPAPPRPGLGYSVRYQWVEVAGPAGMPSPLGDRDTMFLADAGDGHLRAIVVKPAPLMGAPVWGMQVDHIPPGVGPFEGMGLTPLADPAQQARRRPPTVRELVDAKMQLLPADVLMALFIQANNLPDYMVSLLQTGRINVVQPQ